MFIQPIRSCGVVSSGVVRSRFSLCSKNMQSIQFAPQRRWLHAQWTYLLDHNWLYKAKKNVSSSLLFKGDIHGMVESDTSSEEPNLKTILFLHDSHADKSMGLAFARKVINFADEAQQSGDMEVQSVQCLMVNLRCVISPKAELYFVVVCTKLR